MIINFQIKDQQIKKRKEKNTIKNYCRQRRVITRDSIMSSDSFFHLTDFVSICYRQCPTARIEPSPLNKAAETLVTHELSCYCRTLPNLVFFRCMCISVEKNRAKSTKLSLIGSILVQLKTNKDKNKKRQKNGLKVKDLRFSTISVFNK